MKSNAENSYNKKNGDLIVCKELKLLTNAIFTLKIRFILNPLQHFDLEADIQRLHVLKIALLSA